jgi:hypothetical protein
MSDRTQEYPVHKWAWYDFVLEVNAQMFRCSECGRKVPKGESMYVSRRGKHYIVGCPQKPGAIMKRVCSEQCGQKFDYVMMREQARRREHGEL